MPPRRVLVNARTLVSGHEYNPPPPVNSTASEERPLRILVVDDSVDTVRTLAALLNDEGHDVAGVFDGREALAELARFEPDVAIVDLAMPRVSGWELARAVRKIDEKRPMLIAVSGHYTKGADRILAQMSGFDYFLVKPVDPNVLFALLAPLRKPGSSLA